MVFMNYDVQDQNRNWSGHSSAPSANNGDQDTHDPAVVDRGYRGHGVDQPRVLISGTRRGLTPKLIADLRRRSAIEPEIGHMKSDGRLARCPLKGTIGDALFAVLCGCGHNIRKILAHLRALLSLIIAVILAIYRPQQSDQDQPLPA